MAKLRYTTCDGGDWCHDFGGDVSVADLDEAVREAIALSGWLWDHRRPWCLNIANCTVLEAVR